MKIKDIVTFVSKSITPQKGVTYNLFSLPSFDEGKTFEVLDGADIQSNKYEVPNKCILFNKLNVRFKRVWRIDSQDENKIASTEFLPLVVDEDVVDFQYCYYLLISDKITNYLCGQNTNTSGSHKRIDPDNFLNIEIKLPKMSIQRQIGKTLSALDRKIVLNKQINDNLEAMAKQLYDYWFVQFDFPNEEGKPYKSSGGAMVWNEKLKREIPTSFVVKSLSEIIEVKDGTHDSPKPQDNGYFLLTSKHLTERGLDYASAYKISKEDYESINKRSKVDTNDILFSMIGTIGNSYFVEETNINFAIKNMALFKTSAKRWFSEYLYLYLSSCDYKHYEGNSLSGSIQKFVSLRTLRDMPILYHEDIIKVFAKEVRNIITMMVNLRKENIELTKQRDELLPLLMNGQAMVNYHLSSFLPHTIAHSFALKAAFTTKSSEVFKEDRAM